MYPDGIETEEAFGYDGWTASGFLQTITLLKLAGHSPPPQSFVDKVEKMWNYLVNAEDQFGYSPRDGDMDLGRSGWSQAATDYFGRSDWTYIHTGGKEGTQPSGDSASAIFPWGGQAILRNHYEAEGGWVCTIMPSSCCHVEPVCPNCSAMACSGCGLTSVPRTAAPVMPTAARTR